MNRLFKYDGRFQWWSYTVGHGQLLLRSTWSAARPTQVDILFKDVVAVSLPTSVDDIEILESDITDEPGLAVLAGRKRFVVRGREVDGYVIAGAIFHTEGELSHGDQSPLLPKFPP
jgi:hypothetical protein